MRLYHTRRHDLAIALQAIGIERGSFAVLGGIAIAVLMGAAVFTHVRVKNPVFKMLPSSTLLMRSALVAWLNYRMLGG